MCQMLATGVLLVLALLVPFTYSEQGHCQIYNATVCAEYLTGKNVFVAQGTSLDKQEKKLRKWFKGSKESRQINRECWEHAKALTCHKLYPECNVLNNGPILKPLCVGDCKYVKKICKGEYQRTLHSVYYQQYFPLCSEVSLFPKKYCWKLPTYRPEEGPVVYREPVKHFRRKVKESTELRCLFGIRNFLWDNTNKHLIREGTWLRNGKRVVNRRFTIKTDAKGKARLLMVLKIRKLALKDAGKYQCEITFGNITIQNEALLTVTNNPMVITPVVNNANAGEDYSNSDDNKTPGDVEIAGKCVKYSGTVCEAYLKNSLIFERTNHPMDKVNAQLENVIKTLKKTKKLSKRCEEFGQAVLCRYKFLRCHAETYVPVLSLCKSDCEQLHKDYCREELAMLQADRMSLDLFIPKCDLLPDNDAGDCLHISPIKNKNMIHSLVNEEVSCYNEDSDENYIGTLSVSGNGKFCDMWSNYEGYENIAHDHCRNFDDPKPWCFSDKQKEYCNIKSCRHTTLTTETCYRGRGEEYRGKVSTSKSGKSCLQWNRVTHRYSNVDDAYCRNFETNMDAPWCFVDKKETRELCDVPKCEKAVKHTQAVSLVTYVVPSIIGFSVLLFSLFLLIFYLKNKKILTEKHTDDEIVDLRDDAERGDEADFQKMNTLSTTASYDYKKESTTPSSVAEVPVFHFNSTPPVEVKTRFRKSIPEVKEEALQNLVKIGDGKLGQLWQGNFCYSRYRVIPVLVRKLRPDTRPCISSDFRQEMKQLRSLKHPNLEQIVCVSAMSEIPFMAFDGNHKMDLKEYILDDETISNDFLVDCVHQISNGLDYLHQQRVLHKDLALRNCFMTPNGTVYISKSGLGMYRYPDDYKELAGLGLCPVRWFSPETLQSGVYRIPTDIYMLGMVIWELFSNAERPFAELCDDDVMQEILNGNTLICPAKCPLPIWNIIEQCWFMPGCQRPSAYDVKGWIHSFIDKNRNIST